MVQFDLLSYYNYIVILNTLKYPISLDYYDFYVSFLYDKKRMQMETNGGYQTLAMLLRKKAYLIKFDQIILDLIFTMAGTLDAGKEVVGIPNLSAFRDLLCDLDLWHAAELEKSLFEHFYELISGSGAKNSLENIRLLREFSIVEKLLAILKKLDNSSRNSSSTTSTLLKVIHGLLCTRYLICKKGNSLFSTQDFMIATQNFAIVISIDDISVGMFALCRPV